MELNVGDRVRLTGEMWRREPGVEQGDVLAIVEVGDNGAFRLEGDYDWLGDYPGYELEIVEKINFKVGERVRFKPDGDLGTVNGFEDGRIWVIWDNKPGTATWVSSNEISHLQDEAITATAFEQSVRYHTNKIADLLIAKNKAYGDSALNPIRVFSKSDRIEQLNVRIDDKISRIQRGTEYGDEDTEIDLVGYVISKMIARESE